MALLTNGWITRKFIEKRMAMRKVHIFLRTAHIILFKFNGGQWYHNSTYEGWWGFDTLPKLNYEDSEKLQQYILDIAKSGFHLLIMLMDGD